MTEPETEAGAIVVMQLVADGVVTREAAQTWVRQVEAELRRSLAEKVRALPPELCTAASGDHIRLGSFLALIEGTDPASPEPIVRFRSDEDAETEMRALNAGTHKPAVDDFGNQYLSPVAGSTIPPLDPDLLGMALDLVDDEDMRLGVVGRGRKVDRVAAEYARLKAEALP